MPVHALPAAASSRGHGSRASSTAVGGRLGFARPAATRCRRSVSAIWAGGREPGRRARAGRARRFGGAASARRRRARVFWEWPIPSLDVRCGTWLERGVWASQFLGFRVQMPRKCSVLGGRGHGTPRDRCTPAGFERRRCSIQKVLSSWYLGNRLTRLPFRDRPGQRNGGGHALVEPGEEGGGAG